MQGLVQYVTLSVCMGAMGQLQQRKFFKTSVTNPTDNTQQYLTKCLAQIGRQELNAPDLGGRTVPVAIINYPPFLEILPTEGSPSSGAVVGRGMSWDLMMALASYFNFTPRPVVAKHDVIGLHGKDGQWMGTIDLLEEQKAELTLLPVTMTEARQEAIDIFLLGTTTFGILVKRPGYAPKPDALLRPFTQEVWLWILGATVVMGPLIYFIIVFRVRLCKGDPTLTRIFPFNQCVWFVYGAMMKQGSMLRPISDSSRILFATWWLFIMIVTSFYTANLTAFLTFNGLKLPIKKVGDLRSSDDLTWLGFRDGALVDIISTHPKLKILRELQAEGRGRFVDSREEALSLVRTNKYVYIDDMQVLDHLIQEDFKNQQRKKANETCSFYTAPLLTDKDFTFWYGYGFRKNSEYSDLFNGFFRRLSFFGILNFLHNNATSSSPVCTLPKGFKDRRLQNKDLLTTYVLGFAGIVSSFLVLGCEFTCRRRAKKRAKFSNMNQPPSKSTRLASLSIQNLDWGSNLPPLPNIRPRTPFELRYPQFTSGDSNHPATGDRRGKENLETRSSQRQKSQRMKNVLLQARGSPYLIPGKINNLNVVWDRRSNELILQDISKLRSNVVYIEGVPYAVMQYDDKDGPKMQKMILTDLI